MWSNFHMHCNYCDGKGEIKEYVAKAVELHMSTIGFSSHAPVPFESVWCMKKASLGNYLKEIEAIAAATPAIEIYKGLEVDFIPGAIGPADFQQQLDYTIGSVHFVDTFEDGRPWEIDGLHTLFLDGLDKIFGGSIRKVMARYYALTREMMETSCPTVVGHLDKIKIQNPLNKFFSEEDAWYQEEIDHTLEVIGKSGAIVEVNTRGLYQGKSTTPYPSPWILKRILERRIPIALSSDTHHPSDIINRFPETAEMLQSIGFKFLHILKAGQWQPYLFDTHGILS